MTSAIALWAFLAIVAACGSAYFAMRDPRSTAWVKVVLADILLLGFLAALAVSHWFGGNTVGEGLLAHAMLFVVWPMAVVGAPLCLGSIIGSLVVMYRDRDRSLS